MHLCMWVPVGRVCDCEDMGRHLVTFLALVQLDNLFRVDWKTFVRIYYHAEKTGIRLE